jgi:hypothetical protein
MIRKQPTFLLLLLIPPVAAACTFSLFRPSVPLDVPPSSTSNLPLPAATFLPASTSTPTRETAASTPAQGTSTVMPFCEDQRPLALITSFKSAVVHSDGALLASLVSPDHGMDARLFRNGRVVNYDREHAAALFGSSFAVNWGMAPGSGLETVGSFQELVVPDLLDVFSRDYETTCNEIRVGGAAYNTVWPYPGIDFYSLHFHGTQSVDGLDWHTWLLGMHDVQGNPYVYAIMQFKWEP